ncbi:hypothetical protein J1N35_023015 [Gossypium stocksii]|uniref:Reverse transcriptase domain-containing protein n=1 Tax=Gossypium stocksii TaxID=47602 RepID=A0A9D3VJH0_9ROSI|nr:hypothetical protein J1N35_023015 [Gossypium stocksii]
MSAISSSSMQILWNGVLSRKFRLTRGIRQGCPLSSYLFVLCKESLECSIRTKIGLGNWDPIHLSHSGPIVSHIFFADDLVIFCNVHQEQAQRLDYMLK